MTRQPSARELIGKTIVGFETNPRPAGNGGFYHDPTIRLSDGSSLVFVVQETELGEYGIATIRVFNKPRESVKPARHKVGGNHIAVELGPNPSWGQP